MKLADTDLQRFWTLQRAARAKGWHLTARSNGNGEHTLVLRTKTGEQHLADLDAVVAAMDTTTDGAAA